MSDTDAPAAPESPRYVCGVDLGGRRARLCFLDPADQRHPLMVRLEPSVEMAKKKLGHLEHARWAAAWAPAVWQHLDPSVVWFEEPRGRSQRAVFQLSVMAGCLLGGLRPSASVEFVTAGECRKLVGLPGNVAKSGAIEWATLETEADFVFDEHDADAFVVARAILAHGEREDA